jgi:hypothetical protein
MSKKLPRPASAVPKAAEKKVDKDRRVDLLGMTRLLFQILTPVLCETVFQKHRDTEREREWTFAAVIQFWAALVVRHPPSIEQGVEQARRTRGRDRIWPKVAATSQAFLGKCQALRPHFFKAFYEAFVKRLLPRAPQAYASWMAGLREHFPDILVVDGSRLDAVAHRLGLLRPIRSPILPGCVTVFYDLFRGICRQVLFYADAAVAELPRAQDALEWITKGTLILGDRLYSSVQYFSVLMDLGLYGLFRKNGRLKIKRLQVLSRKQGSRSLLEDVLVRVGCVVNQPPVLLRLIRYRGQGRSLDLLTNVLDPKKLSAQQAVSLYGLRWSIERLFLDMKETLDLHTLYSSHPHLVAQQVYATALVHAAFRVAQAGIAASARVLPEQLSPQKLFPRLAEASSGYAQCQWQAIRVRQLNPGVKIRMPDLRSMPGASATLGSLLVQHRRTKRRRRRFCPSRKRWKSLAHIPGGPTLLKMAAVD